MNNASRSCVLFCSHSFFILLPAVQASWNSLHWLRKLCTESVIKVSYFSKNKFLFHNNTPSDVLYRSNLRKNSLRKDIEYLFGYRFNEADARKGCAHYRYKFCSIYWNSINRPRFPYHSEDWRRETGGLYGADVFTLSTHRPPTTPPLGSETEIWAGVRLGVIYSTEYIVPGDDTSHCFKNAFPVSFLCPTASPSSEGIPGRLG